MTKQPVRPAQNPYRVLYWLGGAVALLLVGVLALVMVTRKPPAEAPAVERTLIWLYESGKPGGPAALIVVAESRDDRTLAAVPFPAPEQVVRVFAEQNSRRAADQVATMLERQLHHRVFLPTTVLATLVDAAGGIAVEGRTLTGAGTLAFIADGGEQGARRAGLALLALAEAVTARGVNMGVSQGLSLARQVDTDLDLMSLPDVFARWATYSSPLVASPVSSDLSAVQQLLRPDPAPAPAPAAGK